jgi:DNA-binding transcriptional LysR family regulator
MAEFTIVGLRVLREAARHGSFSTAAETLGYTQSAVSRQIALMEQAAGRALFERQARGVRLTDAGRLVVRHADLVLGEVHATRQALRDLAERVPGRVRVGAFSTAMAVLVPRAVGALLAREPQIRVPLREGVSPSLLAAVGHGRLDVAVVTRPPQPPPGVGLIPLLVDPLLLAVAADHPFAGRTAVHPEALRAERWIAGSSRPEAGLLGAWTHAAWQPDIAFVARDWTAKLGLVAAGLGITVVPAIAVAALPPTIAVTRIDDPAAVRDIAIAHPTAADDPHGRALIDALRTVAADLASPPAHRAHPR